jgi:hypothetical protein
VCEFELRESYENCRSNQSPLAVLSAGWPALGLPFRRLFDGILLHQILQWHHLLSGLESAARDIRFMILTDGLFHLSTYLLALLGIYLLWTTRLEGSQVGSGGQMLRDILLGLAVGMFSTDCFPTGYWGYTESKWMRATRWCWTCFGWRDFVCTNCTRDAVETRSPRSLHPTKGGGTS